MGLSCDSSQILPDHNHTQLHRKQSVTVHVALYHVCKEHSKSHPLFIWTLQITSKHASYLVIKVSISIRSQILAQLCADELSRNVDESYVPDPQTIGHLSQCPAHHSQPGPRSISPVANI